MSVFSGHQKIASKFGGGNYFDLKEDGATAVLVLLGDDLLAPVRSSRGQLFPADIADPAKSLYLVSSAYDPESSSVKLLTGPLGLYNAIGRLSDTVDDIYQCLIKIVRQGSGPKTRWAVSKVKNLDAKELEAIKGAEKLNLAEVSALLKDQDIDAIRAWNLKEAGGSDDDLPF